MFSRLSMASRWKRKFEITHDGLGNTEVDGYGPDTITSAPINVEGEDITLFSPTTEKQLSTWLKLVDPQSRVVFLYQSKGFRRRPSDSTLERVLTQKGNGVIILLDSTGEYQDISHWVSGAVTDNSGHIRYFDSLGMDLVHNTYVADLFSDVDITQVTKNKQYQNTKSGTCGEWACMNIFDYNWIQEETTPVFTDGYTTVKSDPQTAKNDVNVLNEFKDLFRDNAVMYDMHVKKGA